MTKYYNIKASIDSKVIANKMTKRPLEKRLVSSVQQKEISSSYWWNNQIETSYEYLLEMKIKESLYKEVEQEIKRPHPYKVPEIFAEEIKEGLNEYLDWIEKKQSKIK